MSGTTTNINQTFYVPAIDGVRAIAIFLVLIEHWLEPEHLLNNIIPSTGWFGVILFFVLSGFLIGRILLIEKGKVEMNQLTSKRFIYVFYARRFLRIFPVYYLFILIFIFAQYPDSINEISPWLLTYTSNIYANITGDVDKLWPFIHLWTLCVEEQFYIIFPFIILLVPRNKIIHVICTFIAIGVLSKIILGHLNLHYVSWSLFSQLDALGLGLLLAYVNLNNIKFINRNKNIVLLLTSICMLVILKIMVIDFPGYNFLKNNIPLAHLTSFLFLYLIINESESSGLSKFFKFPVLMFIGKISYGIYLYHNVIPILHNYFKPFDDHVFSAEVNFIIYTIEVILLASLSFFLFENPINKLKSYIKY